MAAEIVSPHNRGSRQGPVEDHFAALGVERRFCLDPGELEKCFYRLSRELHPDRFTLQGPEVQKAALDKMTRLNEAYGVLKNPALRRNYLLEVEGVSVASEKTQIPIELAESWFELQDALAESPELAEGRLAQFEKEFRELKDIRQSTVSLFEQEADQLREAAEESVRRKNLIRLAELVREQSYLASMERDIERLRSRFSR